MATSTFADILEDHGRKILFGALDSVSGAKTIVWDPPLMQRFNLMTTGSALKQRNVTNLFLNDANRENVETLVYFVGDSNKSMSMLVEYLNKSFSHQTHHIFFVPDGSFKRREQIENLRTSAKLSQTIKSIESLPIRWFPSPSQNPEVITMLESEIIPKLVLDGDWTQLHKCAEALLQLESMMPQRPVIRYFGEWSVKLSDILEQLRVAKEESELKPNEDLAVDEILVIDRWTDPITPLMTQRTYAGRVDECFGIDDLGFIRVDAGEFSENDQNAERKISLKDDIYNEIRDAVVPGAVAMKFREIFDELRREEEDLKNCRSVAEMKVAVKRVELIVRKKGFAEIHMRLAEMLNIRLMDDFAEDSMSCQNDILRGVGDKIIPFIELSIIECSDLTEVLKLISLQSLVSEGLKHETLDTYRRLIIQSYGQKCLPWLMCLQQSDLIRERGAQTHLNSNNPLITGFPKISKQMRLLVEDSNGAKPVDASYSYGSYAPLLVRHLESHDRSQWKTVTPSARPILKAARKKMLFVIGGLTMAEIASIRLTMPEIISICVTSTITGSQLVRSFDQMNFASA
ncbi:hypothetical protein L596_011399 [Steinernema carpocapsae]|uniref:Uncharacterized protein n=1 Tax=Steinernema carpocapsae TaxID=34508 RepID=A0A4U5NUJ8_STECR|nr:hypothetical protein L596_011399 [Steinernema carpocapsae]